MEFLLLSLIAWVSFVSTSFDSLFVLVPSLASNPSRRCALMFGYGLALVTVVLASWGAAQLGEMIFPRGLGFLGLVPIAMGLMALLRSFRSGEASSSTRGPAPGGVTIAVLTLSMSGDNLGVFIPLFADTSRLMDLVVAFNLIVAAGVWSALALGMSRHDEIRSWSMRWGPKLTPFLLIAVGTYILLDTPTDVS
jgi:cadmium resistance protein CadD (predicted permease)